MRLRGKDGERVHAGRMAEKEARDGLSRFRFVGLIGCGVDGRYRTVRLKKTDPVTPLPSSQPDRMTQYVIGPPPRRAGVPSRSSHGSALARFVSAVGIR